MNNFKALFKRNFTLPALAIPLILVAVLLYLFASPLVVGIYTFALISLSMVLGLQIFMGNSGILSWSYIGFVGIGAFASSIVSIPTLVKNVAAPNMYPFLKAIDFPMSQTILGLQVGPLLGIVAAVIVCVILASIMAWPLMRLSNAVGVITQFSALIIIYVILTQWDNVTNGPRTFFGVPTFTTLWIALAGALIALAVAHFFKQSRLGLQLRASRDDRYAAATTGVSVVWVRYVAFIVSAAIAGFSGALWAHYILSFSPKVFYISEMFVLMSMLIIGGTGSVSGAVVGTFVITFVRQGLRQIEALPQIEFAGLTEISLALFLIVILIVRPSGITCGREISWKAFKHTFSRYTKKEKLG